MIIRKLLCAAVASLAVWSSANPVFGQHVVVEGNTLPDSATTSTEQGQTPLTDSFQTGREWRLETRHKAIEDTVFRFNIRSFYFDQRGFDGSEKQSWAIGGWAGMKTGYFLDHIAFGITGYTSQKLFGDREKDGAGLLRPGQEGYTVLGEAYADIRIVDDIHLFVGRKEFDTPFINTHDNRMTPNTFQAIVLEGTTKFASGATLKYGAGYFDKIKERNAVEFVPMSVAAGAAVHRGVVTGGALFEKGNFSIGAIDYYSPDIINIGYAEAKLTFPINESFKPKLALQFTDQRSVGENLLQGVGFDTQQIGTKLDIPVKKALFTVGYTYTTTGANMQSPWGGYPGYTSVQVEDFNRAGEGAFLLRAGYDFPMVDGLSAYALAVFGTEPSMPGQFARNEYNANLQWGPTKGILKGLSLRLRYGLVQQDGGDVHDLKDFRVICNYAFQF